MLGYLYGSECIITTSFHATVFSIIFKKAFYSLLLEDGRDSRVKNLLTLLSLQDRMISPTDEIKYSDIDYNAIKSTLKSLKDDSISWIDEIIHQ
jgi:hypothetical protein